MKIKVETIKLKKVLDVVGTVRPNSSVLPILSYCLFDVKDGKLNITATDLENYLQVSHQVDVIEEGVVLMHIDTLSNLIKNNKTEELTIENKDKNVIITNGIGNYEIGGHSADDYPNDIDKKNNNSTENVSFNIHSKTLNKAINFVFNSVASAHYKIALTGALIEVKDNKITVVGTDGSILSCFEVGSEKKLPDCTAVIPKKSLQMLNSIIKTTNEDLKISIRGGVLVVESENIVFRCVLISDKYPDFRNIIPTTQQNTVLIEQGHISNSLKRIKCFSSKNLNSVKISVDENLLKLTTEDYELSKSASESINCEYMGDTFDINYNIDNLVICTNGLSGTLVIELEPEKPTIIRQKDVVYEDTPFPDNISYFENYFHLLMPLIS